jgi:hypothetical protein
MFGTHDDVRYGSVMVKSIDRCYVAEANRTRVREVERLAVVGHGVADGGDGGAR